MYSEQNYEGISFWRVNNDINGNPRYVIHFLDIAEDYRTALNISRRIGGKIYRAKWFGGGIVFQSYNIESDIKKIKRG